MTRVKIFVTIISVVGSLIAAYGVTKLNADLQITPCFFFVAAG
jgi:hypothetical protein